MLTGYAKSVPIVLKRDRIHLREILHEINSGNVVVHVHALACVRKRVSAYLRMCVIVSAISISFCM